MLPQNNFWIQLAQRLFSSNPKFFKWVQLISVIIAAVTGLPELLNFFGVHLTGVWLSFENVVIAKMALVSLVIAQLPKNDPPKSTNGDTTGSGDRPPVDPDKP